MEHKINLRNIGIVEGYRECSLELGATASRRGVNPLDRSKYILSVRKALST